MNPGNHTGGHPIVSHTAAGDGSRIRRRLACAGVLTAVMFSLLLGAAPLRRVVGEIGRMGAGWICLAVLLELASCCSFVIVFRLFFDRVPRRAGQELAWTALGAGSLLPGGGIGALAAGGWLLHQAGISRREILQRSSGLFLLTSAASVAAMITAGGLLVAEVIPGPHDLLRAGVPAVAGCAVIVAVVALPGVWRRSDSAAARPGWLGDLVDGIGVAVRSLTQPTWRLLGAVGYLANLLPVPGSVGVLDVGLAGTLVAYGAPATQAVAAVLVYHAIAFWIPGVGGLFAYALVRRRLASAPAVIDGPATVAPSAGDRWAPAAIPTAGA
jgi:uncharacterized membrane protein YbhN (UPF0104 family)